MGTDADATRSQPPEALEVAAPTPAAAPSVVPGEFMADEPEQYRVERQIGAGGMGMVLAARGQRLGRSVAVKVITVDREDLRRRFEREARVTARLQHPGIVPVYGTGRGRDGRLFYAMKHVTGRPLDQVIADTSTLPERIALLPKVLAVAEAIAFAHSERVIHRDLKPANVLIGGFGEAVVIDWGLAKDLSIADEPDGDGASSESPYRSELSDATQHGKVMGTPAYMPPEQARGEPVDERADVYALGAIIYHLLAGAPPFARAGEGSVPWETMLARVLTGTPPPLDQKQPGLPSDLLAVVTRSMAPSAADRYPSAAELADDLRRFQTGQLVGAHRYSTRELLRRWLRRHRTAVLVGAAGVAILAVVATVSVMRIIRAQHRAEAALHLAEKQRDQAESLSEFMLFDLRDKLKTVGRLDLMEAVAIKARDYYTAQPPPRDDVELLRRAALHNNLGDVLTGQGDSTGALAAYRSSADMARQVIRRDPKSVGARDALATVGQDIAYALHERGESKAALTAYEESLDLRRALAEEDPGSAKRQREHAGAIWVRSNALNALGDVDGAIAVTRDALARLEQERAKHPDDIETEASLAQVHRQLGIMVRQRDNDESLAHYRAAFAVSEARSRAAPKDMRWLEDHLGDHERVGDALTRLGKFKDARDLFVAGLAVAERLQAQDPSNAEHTETIATMRSRIGDSFRSLGDPGSALVEYRATAALREELLRRDPDNLAWLKVRIVNLENIGEALRELKDPRGALASYEQALAIVRNKRSDQPKSTDWGWYEAVLHENLAAVYLDLEDAERSLAEHLQSKASKQALVAADPTNLEWQHGLYTSHLWIGEIHRNRKQYAEALLEFQSCLSVSDLLIGKLPDHPTIRRARVQVFERIARTQLALGRNEEALENARVSTEWAERLLELDPANVDARGVVYGTLTLYARTLIANKRGAAALPDLQRALVLAEGIRREQPTYDDMDTHIAELQRLIVTSRRMQPGR